MNVLIIGANGKIGRIVAKKMGASDWFKPTAFIRKEEQKNFFDAIRVPVIVGSLESSIDELTKAMKGFDAIVFTAGSGGKTGYDKTLEIDLDGAVKSIAAAEQAGVKRYVMVSAYLADERDKWDASGIKPYYIAKHVADKELKQSSLDFTILRPVGLTDEEGIGKVTLNKVAEGISSKIPRTDVATTILEVLSHDESIGKIFVMSSGTSPIADAVLAL